MSNSTFSDRRSKLYSILSTLAEQNSSVYRIYNLLVHNYIESNNLCKELQDENFSYYFLRSVTLSVEDEAKPAYWDFIKYPDTSNYNDSECHVRTRWSVFIKKLVKWGLLPEDFPVERTANYITDQWPRGEEYTFKVEESAVETYSRKYLGSCMHDKDYVRFYDDNKDVVRVIGIYHYGNYMGRALRWIVKDENGNEVTYLDRVYPSDGGAHTRAIRDWASEQGWLYKEYDNYHDEERALSVVMKWPSNGMFPYMDTFKYATDETGGQTTVRLDCCDTDYEVKLDSTDGGGFDNLGTCSHCGDRVDTEDTFTVMVTGSEDTESWCRHCIENDATYIPYNRRCNSIADGYYVPNENAIHLDDGAVVTEWDDVSQCDVCDQWFFNDDLTVTTMSNRQVCHEHVIEDTDGDIYATDELDEYHLILVDDEYQTMGSLLEENGFENPSEKDISYLFREVNTGRDWDDVLEEYVAKQKDDAEFENVIQMDGGAA